MRQGKQVSESEWSKKARHANEHIGSLFQAKNGDTSPTHSGLSPPPPKQLSPVSLFLVILVLRRPPALSRCLESVFTPCCWCHSEPHAPVSPRRCCSAVRVRPHPYALLHEDLLDGAAPGNSARLIIDLVSSDGCRNRRCFLVESANTAK